METLTVAFTAARAFASASLPVLKLFILASGKLFHESVWVTLHNTSLGSFDFILLIFCIETVGAAAFSATVASSGEALAVELEAARATALALARHYLKSSWFKSQL